jgi:predicted RNA-binding Zn-ribbon protein involved in translation (DUF1610 family)
MAVNNGIKCHKCGTVVKVDWRTIECKCEKCAKKGIETLWHPRINRKPNVCPVCHNIGWDKK